MWGLWSVRGMKDGTHAGQAPADHGAVGDRPGHGGERRGEQVEPHASRRCCAGHGRAPHPGAGAAGQARIRSRGTRPARLAFTTVTGRGHRPRRGPPVPGRRGCRPSCRDAPQTPHRVARAAGVRGHQRQRDADGCSRRPSPPGWELCVHQQHQRLRPGAHAAAGEAATWITRTSPRFPGTCYGVTKGGGRGPVRDHRP